MAIKQTIWSLDEKKELANAALISENELEDLIAGNIGLLDDNWMVVGRQVRTDHGGIIDLLCIDVGVNLIVVELKKDMTPREVTAQALDYASWLDGLDADRLADIYLKYTNNSTPLDKAYKARFGVEMAKDRDDEETDVQIVIVATTLDSSSERIIQYLRERGGISINVLFFNVFTHNGSRYLSRAWLHQTDEEAMKPKKEASRNWNGEFYLSFGVGESRSWDDAAKYGFVSAGGGSWYTDTLKHLKPGDRIWVNIPRSGYVGVGVVTSSAVPANEAIVSWEGQDTRLHDIPLHGKYDTSVPDREEYVVGVAWTKTFPQKQAVSEYGFFGNQNTVCKPKDEKWAFTVQRLKALWGVE